MHFVHKVSLKCRFNYFSGMMRPDQETTATERQFAPHSSQEGGACYITQRHMGEHQCGSESKGRGGKCGQKCLFWFQQAMKV